MAWPSLSLGDVTDRFFSGGTPDTKEPEYWGGTIPWVTGADFGESHVTLGRKYISEKGLKGSATNLVPKGCLLIVTRTGVGKLAIAPTDMAISQDITGVELKSAMLPAFAAYAINAKVGLLRSAQRGATIKGITRRDLAELPLPLPTLSEQRKIVEILDQAEDLRKKRAEADKIAARILPALFYKMFGDPVEYAQSPLAQPLATVVDVNPTMDKRSLPGNQAVGFVSMADIDETIGRIAKRQTREVEAVKSGYTSFVDNDVLFAKITPCMQNGKAALVGGLANGIGFGSTEFHVLRAKDGLAVPEWLYGLVRLPVFRRMAESTFTGTAGQQRVPRSFIERFPVVLPSMEAQKQFSSAIRRLHQSSKASSHGADSLSSLLNSLLSQSFTGELTAQWRNRHRDQLRNERKEQAEVLGIDLNENKGVND